MSPIASANGAEVYNLDWRALASVVEARGGCDALVTDCPYSERTHAGHDNGTAQASKVWLRSNGKYDVPADRRSISYTSWSVDDVRAFVDAWHPLCRGWFVTITDDVLAHDWQRALAAVGRYAFAPMPFVAPGSRVRLTGDGPSNWTCWIVVARPKTQAMARWGTLPGAYVLPPGEGGAMPVVGGKPAWLMESLCRDYSRPGNLVVDPCCGAGTTLAAAIRQGRRAIGGDIDPAHAALAAQWIANPHRKAPGIDRAPDVRQPALFGAP